MLVCVISSRIFLGYPFHSYQATVTNCTLSTHPPFEPDSSASFVNIMFLFDCCRALYIKHCKSLGKKLW